MTSTETASEKYREAARQQVEMILQRDRVSRVEAFRRAADQFGDLGELGEAIQQLWDEYEQGLQLVPTSESQILDEKVGTWYEGPREEEGYIWGRLRRRMESGGLRGAVDQIDKHSTEIVERLAEPAAADARRRGLVIGYVQSGKTASYASGIAKAADAQYKMVIVLAGIHGNLRKQTQLRLDSDLGVDDGAWYRMTDETADMGKEAANARSLVNSGQRLLAVVKKNKTRLQNLEAFLREIPEERRRDYPILILDDESDQASPDSAVKDEEMSTIHEKLRDIWSLVGNGSYVSYTATPFANLFMEPDSPGSLYPKDFIHVLPEPKGYLGTAQLFGSTIRNADPEHGDDYLDVVRSISDEDRARVVPPSKRKGEDAEPFEPDVPPSLEDAIVWFILATAIRRFRGQEDKHSSMLVHTTHKVEPHFAHRDAIVEFLGQLRDEVKVHEDLSRFQRMFVEEGDRVSELQPEDADQLTFRQLEGPIRSALTAVRVYVDNGSEKEEERVSYRDKPLTAIIVGGTTLSRGLTLEGLFVSYFARRSATYDTLLQMGRWFGFRPGYGDLVRLWLSEGLAGDYQFLADVEAQVRQDIDIMRENGQIPEQVGIRVQQHPGRLSITGAGKMKHVETLHLGLEGRRVETNTFDTRPEILRENLQTTSAFLSSMAESGQSPVKAADGGSIVFEGVPYEGVRRFLEGYRPHRTHRLLEDGQVLQWLDKWDSEVTKGRVPAAGRENLWNVVVMSGGRDARWTASGHEVATVNRAPLQEGKKPSSISDDPDAVGIRALMSSQDHLADLRILKEAGIPGYESLPSRCSEKEAAEYRRSLASGRGLLVLYLVDKDSEPRQKKEQTTRTKMKAEEHIAGFGMISPSDPTGLQRDNEVYVGVVPHWTEPEEDEDEAPSLFVDDEGDYVGEDLS